MLPDLRDATFALRVGKLSGRGAGAVEIATNFVVQKSSRVDLAERFLGSVVGEAFQLLTDLLAQVIAFAQRNLPTGSLVQVLQIQPPAGDGFSRKDLPVFHVSESRISSVWSSLALICSITPG